MKQRLILLGLLVVMSGFSVAAQESDFCPGAPEARLTLYEQGRVTEGGANNVRELASVNANLVDTLPGGAIFTVIDGPVCADGYLWWQVNTDEIYGWTAEGTLEDYWLEPYPPVFTIEGSDILYEGIAFTLDPLLGSAVDIRYYDAVEAYPDGPGWDVHPAYDEFRLVDYPTDNMYFKPVITIYPAEEFAAMSEYAADQISAMQDLLADPPATGITPDVPLMPIFNAARVFQAQTAYLEFENGAGYRFVTHYSQAIDVLTNESVFYTFQGLTDDGKYWVSIFMPIHTSVLPDMFDYNDADFDWDAFADGYLDYIADTTATLNDLDSAAFTPSLDMLDALVASLLVTDGSL